MKRRAARAKTPPERVAGEGISFKKRKLKIKAMKGIRNVKELARVGPILWEAAK